MMGEGRVEEDLRSVIAEAKSAWTLRMKAGSGLFSASHASLPTSNHVDFGDRSCHVGRRKSFAHIVHSMKAVNAALKTTARFRLPQVPANGSTQIALQDLI